MTSVSYCKVDPKSVATICKGSDQIMVYGPKHCFYEEIATAIKRLGSEKDFPIKKVFTWRVACDGSELSEKTTLEKRNMNVIPFESGMHYPRSISRPCKTAEADLVLENYKRKKEGKAVIPLVFCIDIDKNRHPLKIDELLTKDEEYNTLIYHKEMRRAFKLCHDPKVDPKLRAVAKETFRFVKVKIEKDNTFVLEQVPAPWASSETASGVSEAFAEEWAIRKEESESRAKPAYACWRTQLARRSAAFDVEFEKAQAEKASEKG